MQKVLCLLLLLFASLCATAQNTCSDRDEATLKTARLSDHARNEIRMVIEKELRESDSEIEDPGTLALTSWVNCIQLAQTGPPVILVTSGPEHPATEATGNRELWLFRKIGSHAELILQDGGSVYRPASKTYHNGMRDFKTWGTSGGGDGAGEVFRFDGKRYRSLYCYKTTTVDGEEREGPPRPCKAN